MISRARAYPGAAAALFGALTALYANLVTKGLTFEVKYSLYRDLADFYWVQAFVDKGLFPRDPIVAFLSAHVNRFSPWAGICFTSLFMHPHPYTIGLKALSVLACTLASFMFYRMAAGPAARPAAVTAGVLFVPYFLSQNLFFGAPRVYGGLLLLAFLWAAESGSFLLLPVISAASLVFYTPNSLSMALSCLLAPLFYRAAFSERRLLPRYLAIAATSAAVCLSAFLYNPAMRGLLRGLRAGSGFEDSRLYQFVTTPVHPGNLMDMLFYFYLNINEHSRLYPVMSALLLALFALGWYVRRGAPKLLPRSVLMALAASTAAFLLSYPVHVVSAARQTVFIVPLVLVFLAAEGIDRFSGGKPRIAVLAVASATLFALLHPWLNEIVSVRTYSAAYGYISRLKGDVLLAGHPESLLTATIPVFSQRSVLVADDLRDQYELHLSSREAFSARRAALLAALYSDSPSKACALRSVYGVDYLVLEDRYFSQDHFAMLARSGFPLNEEISRAIAASPDPRGFYSYAKRRAAFSWKDAESGGVIFDLSLCGARP